MSTSNPPKIVHEWYDLVDAIEAYRARRASPRVTTGLARLDRLLGGLDPGLHLLMGSPGAGKTALALQIAQHLATSGREVRYLSAEMSPGVIAHRIALSAGVALDDLARLRLPTILSGPWSVMDLAIMARDEKLDAIIIDSFHAAASNHSGQSAELLSEYDLFSAWSSSLSMIGVETGVAILAIAHRNRSSNTKSGEAGLHAAKGTGSLEYLAETVIDISSTRDEVLSKKRERAIKVNVEKNRQGATGSVDIRFDTWRQTFSE